MRHDHGHMYPTESISQCSEIAHILCRGSNRTLKKKWGLVKINIRATEFNPYLFKFSFFNIAVIQWHKVKQPVKALLEKKKKKNNISFPSLFLFPGKHTLIKLIAESKAAAGFRNVRGLKFQACWSVGSDTCCLEREKNDTVSFIYKL